jgi:hypothetical protein
MNIVRLSLSTRYDSKPSHIKIICCGDVIHDDTITGGLDLTHTIEHFEKFKISIEKTGKTKDIVDQNHYQDVMVTNLNLNGIDLKIKEFGRFQVRDNSYVEDYDLQTNVLNLNGEWSIELPVRTLVGDVRDQSWKMIKDDFKDSDIACFGCSQTYGVLLDNSESWPYQTHRLTDKSVMNYGVPGSNINEITALVDTYLKDHKAEIILIYFPHTFRRQMIKDGQLKNIGTTEPENKNLIMHGEEHSVASIGGDLLDWLDKISQEADVFFSTYHREEFELYQKNPILKKFMFPFLHNDDYPKASDGFHAGPEFNRDFAKMLVDFLDLG